jgi:hypothetical protein
MPDQEHVRSDYELPKIWIDEPVGRLIQEPEFLLRGWGVCTDRRVLDSLAFRTSAKLLSCRKAARPDIYLYDTNLEAIGFAVSLSLSDHLSVIDAGKLKIWVLAGRTVIGQFHLRIAAGAIGKVLQSHAG